jgi:hypothetical protein
MSSETASPRERVLSGGWRGGIGAVALCVIYVLSYRHTLRQWWLWDDPQILFSAQNGLFSLLFDPGTWCDLTSSNFTPLLACDYRIDLLLFGAEPAGYYLHALVVGIAAVIALFFFLRTVTSDVAAFAAAAALIVAPASQRVLSLLMDRHYAEGLLFCALSLLCFRKAGRVPLFYVPAGMAYLLACLEKEFWAPLPVIALAIAWMSDQRRAAVIRTLATTVTAAAIYVVWRAYILGSVGGYGPSLGSPQVLRKLHDIGVTALGFQSWLAPAFLLSIVVLQALLARSRGRAALVLAAIAVAMMVPFVGLQSVGDDRYVFAATVLLLGGSAVAAASSDSAISRWAFAALVAAFTIGGLAHRGEVLDEHRRMAAEGRMLWTSDASQPLLLTSNAWYVDGIRWLRWRERGDEAPRGFGSYEAIALSGVDPATVLVNSNGAFRAAPLALRRGVEGLRSEYVGTLPLSVRFSRSGPVLEWRVASPGSDEILLLAGTTGVEIPLADSEGWMRVPNAPLAPTAKVREEGKWFRVVARHRDVWTASPPLRFPDDGKTLRWERPAAAK